MAGKSEKIAKKVLLRNNYLHISQKCSNFARKFIFIKK